jgi:hypothetical protein
MAMASAITNCLRIVCSCPDSIDRTATGFNPYEVVSQIVQLLLDPRLSGFADGHNTDYRRDPDGDPKNREKATHLISEQGHNG